MKNECFALFDLWFTEARSCSQIVDATSFSLATSTPNGAPSVRILLLKNFEIDGFSFFTNKLSKKGQNLLQNPLASMCFYWEALGKQIRIEGVVRELDESKNDEYFFSRRKESQIGAIASRQSQKVESYETFLHEYEKLSDSIGDKIERPPHWGGFILLPTYVEFWQNGDFRLHKRTVYERDNSSTDQWSVSTLYP